MHLPTKRTHRQRLDHLKHFFSRKVWEVPLESLTASQAKGYTAGRIIYRTVQGLVTTDTLSVRAAALTYYSVLSLVPLLAFVFALLKGFGAYQALVEDTIQPYVLDTFDGNPPLQRALEQVLSFVSGTGVTSLGFLGLLVLLYAAVRLLHSVESAFNEIWGIPSGRGVVKQITDYLAIIVVTPICLMLAGAIAATSQSWRVMDLLENALGLGRMLETLIATVGPLAIAFVGLVFLYTVMPFTTVRIRSALIGALVGAVLWYAALILHVRFQMGVARFNALYAGFGALPIFLVWVYVSWLTVMIGAQVAATHQNNRSFAQGMRAAQADQRTREILALSALLIIGRAFLSADNPPRLQSLSLQLSAPELLLSQVLAALEQAGLVVRVDTGADPRFVLGRAPEQVRLTHVLEALRVARDHDEDPANLADVQPLRQAETALRQLDEPMAASAYNVTLGTLLATAELAAPALPAA